SRRRHTRFSRDWSSDVCSSDLHVAAVYVNRYVVSIYIITVGELLVDIVIDSFIGTVVILRPLSPVRTRRNARPLLAAWIKPGRVGGAPATEVSIVQGVTFLSVLKPRFPTTSLLCLRIRKCLFPLDRKSVV